MKILMILGLLSLAHILNSYENHEMNEDMLRRACNSISQVEGDKIFFNPEKLHLKQGMIFVEDKEGAELPIPVFFSSKGLKPFMQVAENILFNLWKCDCGAWNHRWDNPTHCWSCGEPR